MLPFCTNINLSPTYDIIRLALPLLLLSTLSNTLIHLTATTAPTGATLDKILREACLNPRHKKPYFPNLLLYIWHHTVVDHHHALFKQHPSHVYLTQLFLTQHVHFVLQLPAPRFQPIYGWLGGHAAVTHSPRHLTHVVGFVAHVAVYLKQRCLQRQVKPKMGVV